jgi:hypothetical protein
MLIIHVPFVTLSRQYSCTSHLHIPAIQIPDWDVDHSCSMFHVVKAVKLYITCVQPSHSSPRLGCWSFMFHRSRCQGSTVVHHMCTSEPFKSYIGMWTIHVPCFTLSRQYSCTSHVHIRAIQILDWDVDHSCSMFHVVKAVQLYITCVHPSHPNPWMGCWSFMFHVSRCQGSTVVHHMCTAESFKS